MASEVNIHNNLELLDYLDSLERNTDKFFNSNERSAKGIYGTLVQLRANLVFNDKMCKEVAKRFKYFKGVLEGNGNTITVASSKATSLFTSIYYSVIKNLTIHNIAGSNGMLLAYDINDSIFENVHLTGTFSIQQALGGFTNTTKGITFKNCSVNVEAKYRSSTTHSGVGNREPIHFGGFTGVDLGGTKFEDCTVSGKMDSEVSVGAFCGIAKNVSFRGCDISELEITGKREVGGFVGKGLGHLDFQDCVMNSSRISASSYLGYLVGRNEGTIYSEGLVVMKTNLVPNNIATYVGGIAGSSYSIKLVDCYLQGGITGHFIIAGVSADSAVTEVINTEFDLDIIAIGYPPMMTHVYEIARTEFLTASGKQPTLREEGNRKRIRIQELEMEGLVNPFEESIL